MVLVVSLMSGWINRWSGVLGGRDRSFLQRAKSGREEETSEDGEDGDVERGLEGVRAVGTAGVSSRRGRSRGRGGMTGATGGLGGRAAVRASGGGAALGGTIAIRARLGRRAIVRIPLARRNRSVTGVATHSASEEDPEPVS